MRRTGSQAPSAQSALEAGGGLRGKRASNSHHRPSQPCSHTHRPVARVHEPWPEQSRAELRQLLVNQPQLTTAEQSMPVKERGHRQRSRVVTSSTALSEQVTAGGLA